MPTIFDLEESNLSVESKHLKLPVSVTRKSLTKRVYQQDQFKLFEEQDKIKSFDDINFTRTPPEYTFRKYDNLVVFYGLETVLNVTEVTDSMRVHRDLNVKLFFKCFSSCFLKELKFKKKKLLSNVIRYSSLPRYNFLQTYRLLMKEFPFPSLSLMKKITEGQLDAVKCPKSLKSQGMISEDIVLMFDEMYLQKCEEYCGGEIVGANENNDLRINRIYDHRIKRKCPLNYQICSRAKH